MEMEKQYKIISAPQNSLPDLKILQIFASKNTKNETKENVCVNLPGLFLRISKSLNGPWSSICLFKKKRRVKIYNQEFCDKQYKIILAP